MVKMNKTDKRNLIAAYLIIAVLMVIPALRLHMSMTVDELGTFANSALLAGYDWTDAVHSAGDYYYKYGTALFYTLPYIFIKDSIVLYRVLMAINGLLLGTTALMAYLVCRKHMGVKSENQALAFALAGAGVPAALLHCIYGRADYVLVRAEQIEENTVFRFRRAGRNIHLYEPFQRPGYGDRAVSDGDLRAADL